MIFHACKADGESLGQFDEEDFREKISKGELRPDHHYYWCEGMADWKPISTYRLPNPARPQSAVATTPKQGGWTAIPALPKKPNSAAAIGGYCALAGAFVPLVHPFLFFIGSLPLLLAAFVLAIVSIAKSRVLGGILLLAGLVIAGPISFMMLVDRNDLLHHPETLAQEQRERDKAEERDAKKQEIAEAIENNRVIVGMTKAQVQQSWGPPFGVRYPFPDREEWNYGAATKLYFENGVLVRKSN